MDITVNLAIGSLLTVIFLWFVTRPKNTCTAPAIPGLPLVGNAHQLDNNNLHKSLTNLVNKYGDVFQFSMFGKRFLVINSPSTAYEAMVKRGMEFGSRPYFYRSVVCGLEDDMGFK